MQFGKIVFLGWFTSAFNRIRMYLPLLMALAIAALEFYLVIFTSKWDGFTELVMYLKQKPLVLVAFYVPFLLLLGPRSLISTLSGYIFGFKLGFCVDFVGVFMGVSVIVANSRLVILPLLHYIYQDYQHIGDEHEYYWGSIAHRVNVIKKLDINPYKLVTIFNVSPLVPVHASTYLLSLSRINPLAVITMTCLCNIPTSIFYSSLGSSFTNPNQILDHPNYIVLIPALLITIWMGFTLKDLSSRLAIEVDEDDDVEERDEMVYAEISTFHPVHHVPIVLNKIL